jgi:outer membrane usher protein FimD/PapC
VVLIGATAVNNISIDNSQSDSVVTITETGGQQTVLTLVGVDVALTDIVFGG